MSGVFREDGLAADTADVLAADTTDVLSAAKAASGAMLLVKANPPRNLHPEKMTCPGPHLDRFSVPKMTQNVPGPECSWKLFGGPEM